MNERDYIKTSILMVLSESVKLAGNYSLKGGSTWYCPVVGFPLSEWDEIIKEIQAIWREQNRAFNNHMFEVSESYVVTLLTN